jgi:hypothetical protein
MENKNNEFLEAEEIRCYGINFNKEARDKDRAVITYEDKINNLNAQEIIDLI